jgi:hypothetical protein
MTVMSMDAAVGGRPTVIPILRAGHPECRMNAMRGVDTYHEAYHPGAGSWR